MLELISFRYTKHPEWFRSDRICMLDAVCTQMWTAKYSEFLASPANPDCLGKLLPHDALDYYTGEETAYNRSNKTWALEIDDIYVPLFVKNDHWVACWISIPRRHIVIWDSDVAYTEDAEITETVKPIAHMLLYMLHMLSIGGEKELYTVDSHMSVNLGCHKTNKLVTVELLLEVYRMLCTWHAISTS
ncbi:unnamed protein product [Brassica oleracea var. botrytis]|uniref:Ubiquitin-like protease family profile domain-containing protein n=1 Tax=Brassica oleracea TaxID=3712 RepID=A0A3P6EJM3_BRAOL|nr:unnamed protein product [Brassica oleracea]